MNDPTPRDPLSSALRAWRHKPGPAPDFRARVWTRIRSADTARTASVFPFPQALPLAASLAILASVAAGTGTAFALNRTLSTERMAVAYVRTIDPVQLSAAGTHSPHQP